MPQILIDPDSRSLAERFALVRAPGSARPRFPEGCVTLDESESAARAGADPQRQLRPALVYGPSPSSEGQRVFYLVRWLE